MKFEDLSTEQLKEYLIARGIKRPSQQEPNETAEEYKKWLVAWCYDLRQYEI